jgi:hypothetical protein
VAAELLPNPTSNRSDYPTKSKPRGLASDTKIIISADCPICYAASRDAILSAAWISWDGIVIRKRRDTARLGIMDNFDHRVVVGADNSFNLFDGSTEEPLRPLTLFSRPAAKRSYSLASSTNAFSETAGNLFRHERVFLAGHISVGTVDLVEIKATQCVLRR